MLKKKEIISIIKENAEKIKAYGVKKIGIFGSFATYSQNDKSDVDILVEFEDGKKTFDNYMELKFYLEKLLHRKVDLVLKDALKSRIRQNILRGMAYAGL